MVRQIFGRFLPPLAIALSIFGVILVNIPAQAATFSPPCSLGAAELRADALTAGSNGEPDTINLSACFYYLDEQVVFAADGGNAVTINGNGAVLLPTNFGSPAPQPIFRLLNVEAGAVVTINNVRFLGGFGDVGGAIYNEGSLTINNSLLERATVNATDGGSIANIGGTLVINGSTVELNIAARGGGVFSDGGSVTITNTTFTENEALTSHSTTGGIGEGGSIWLDGGTLAINGSTIYRGVAARGGGIYSEGSSITVTGSNVSQNRVGENFGLATVGGEGGGVWQDGGSLSMVNSSVFYNASSARADGGGGGGFWLTGTTASFINSTIAHNNSALTPVAIGGGLAINGGSVTVQNSIIANNGVSVGSHNCAGTILAQYSFLEFGASDCTLAAGSGNNVIGTEPGFDAPTGTPAYLPLLPSSDATNIGSNALVPVGLDEDQAGNDRIQAGIVDAGAFESSAPIVSLSPSGARTIPEGTNEDFTLTRVGDTTADLMVSVTITQGTGMNSPSDYVLSALGGIGQSGTTTVTIPAGSASVVVNFAALDEIDAEPDNTLTLALNGAGVDYDLGTGTSVAITIPLNDFGVTTTANSGEGSLRQAISNANFLNSNDTIIFSMTGTTFTPTADLPNLATAASSGMLIIDGNGNTVSGNDARRVFVVDSGANVSINNLTITQGRSPVANGGGGILSDGTLALTGVTLSNNQAVNWGGGLLVNSGSATVSGSQITSNLATASGPVNQYGAGIGLVSGSLTVTGSTFSDNGFDSVNYGHGGAIGAYNLSPATAALQLTVSGSTFTNNRSFYGAAIGFTSGFAGSSASFSNNFISGNTAQYGGGGLYFWLDVATPVSITNNTIAENVTTRHDGGGGGIFVYKGGPVTINNSTVVENTASQYGSNIRVGNYPSNVTINNSIFANGLGGASDCMNYYAGPMTIRYSLIVTQGPFSDISCGAIDGVNGNIVGHDPDLGALNGNHYPLNSGSPAIDTGDDTLIPMGVTSDQIGALRVQGSEVDMGAVESSFTPVIVSLTPGGTTTLNEGQPGVTIILSRTGDTTNPLTIALNLPIGGNLTPSDYSISGTSAASGNMTATIPGGSSTTTITIAALTDSVGAELDDSMTLTIIDTVDYNVGAPNSATLFFPRNDLNVVHGNANGEGSLYYAILNANIFPGADVIALASGLSINGTTPNAASTSESYRITDSVTISGDNTQTVNGDTSLYQRRVFTLDGGTTTLQGFTISGADSYLQGAAVGVVSGSATLGISGLPMMLVNNIGRYCGAGLWVGGGNALVQAGTHINGNNPGYDGMEYGAVGGGICVEGGSLTIDGAGTQVNENSSSFGGGLVIIGGTVTVQNGATVDNNTSLDDGGGIAAAGGTLIVQNGVSISGNTAVRGGGITHYGEALTVTGSIINRNIGGAIYVYVSGSSTTTVNNTCITGNSDTAFRFDNTETGINATSNWWGSSAGPYSGQDTPTPPNDANTLVSNGDSVQHSTDPAIFNYSGYLTSPPTAIASSCLTCAQASSIAGARVCDIP